MDYLELEVFALLFLLTSIIAFIVGIAIGSRRIRSRENAGEARVRQALTARFKPPEFHLLNNITLPYEDGTTQIDHILISTKGVFVIETKHYSGWIFANENAPHWTQIIYKFMSKTPNPFRQNFRHMKVVRELLDFIPKEHIHSMVVFTGNAVFKTEIPSGVVYLSGLTECINMFRENVITPNRVQFIVGRLECKRYEISKQTDVEHKAFLNRKYGNN